MKIVTYTKAIHIGCETLNTVDLIALIIMNHSINMSKNHQYNW